MKVSLWLTILFLTASGTLVDLSAKTPQRRPLRKLRVVIDASHDGGAWWFPQGPEFDPRRPHQGSVLAEYLKRRGWEVVEVPRGAKIANQFRGASIVVRMNLFGVYENSEVVAYQRFVRNGGSLLLVEGFVRDREADNDSVARQFGVRFEGMVDEPAMHGTFADTFMRGVGDVAFQNGSIVVKYPRFTQPLAYVSNERLVMGTVRYGRGRIIFLSSVFTMLHVPQPFTMRLSDELARSHSRKKRR